MAFLPLITALISAAGSIGGGLLSRRGSEETPIQGQQGDLISQIMASIQGEGPFSDLFKTDDETFQKSFVDPAQQRFRDVTAPGIQQQFIASGQQRGTGLENQLAQAGIDMDQILNQQYAGFQQQGQQNLMNLMSSVLGQGAGARPEQTFGQAAGQAVGGYFGSSGFESGIDSLLKAYTRPKINTGSESPREGFVS